MLLDFVFEVIINELLLLILLELQQHLEYMLLLLQTAFL